MIVSDVGDRRRERGTGARGRRAPSAHGGAGCGAEGGVATGGAAADTRGLSRRTVLNAGAGPKPWPLLPTSDEVGRGSGARWVHRRACAAAGGDSAWCSPGCRRSAAEDRPGGLRAKALPTLEAPRPLRRAWGREDQRSAQLARTRRRGAALEREIVELDPSSRALGSPPRCSCSSEADYQRFGLGWGAEQTAVGAEGIELVDRAARRTAPAARSREGDLG